MDGLYYLLSIVAVGVVIRWFMQNDGRDESEPTVGILSMLEPSDDVRTSSPH
jgi:hypothetical protein